MKYCSKCGRELFDKDIACDKCKSTDFISKKECEEIIQKINNSNTISRKILLKDPIYKMVYNFIINKPRDYFNPCIANSNNNESNEEYFERINEHTINKIKQENILKCPYCQSTSISKIGTLNRVISVSMFGLASKKIGKQWHCNSCKSDF